MTKKSPTRSKSESDNTDFGVELAEMILEMDAAAREQGLYVGAGRDGRLPNLPQIQEGPRWRAIKARAKQIIAIAEEHKDLLKRLADR